MQKKELDIFDIASKEGEKLVEKLVEEELPKILEKREKEGFYSTNIIDKESTNESK